MGARTDAARAEVVARRELLLHEATQLEAAGRAAVDIPAKVRRAPAKTAGLAAGTAFLVLGGPQRLYRRARRAVLGERAELPKSMLPPEIDKRLRRLGDDGQKVRGLLEREFAGYLDEHRKDRESRELGATLIALSGSVLKPVSTQIGKRLAGELAKPDAGSFGQAVDRIRARQPGGGSQSGAPAPPAAPAQSGDKNPRR